MFPPTGAESMSLGKCVRVLPHHNNTGGFFVCCLRKVAELDSSRIFVSNKSKERVAPGKRQQAGRKSQRQGEALSSLRSTSAEAVDGEPDVPSGSKETADPGAASAVSSAATPERNPLLDGELLAEESNAEGAALGATESACEQFAMSAAAGAQDSLYSLAAAASKPGGLFHLLLPANCDADGSEEVKLIVDFFGLNDKTALVGSLSRLRIHRAITPALPRYAM